MRAAIAGEEEPGAALRTIADRGGLPVVTSTGSFLFGCLCGPGTWNLSGAHNGWADSPMGVTGPMVWSRGGHRASRSAACTSSTTRDQDQWIADPLGRRYGFDEFGRFSLVRAEAAHLERWFAVAGEGLGPRDLQVWVPNGGEFTHALYVHDGQNLFDPGAPPTAGGACRRASRRGCCWSASTTRGSGGWRSTRTSRMCINQDPIGGQGGGVRGARRGDDPAAHGGGVRGGGGGRDDGVVARRAGRVRDRGPLPDTLRDGDQPVGDDGLGVDRAAQRDHDRALRGGGAGRFALYLDSGGDGLVPRRGRRRDRRRRRRERQLLREPAAARRAESGSGTPRARTCGTCTTPAAGHNELHWAARVGVPMATFAGL
jgi:hypothetical protein